MKAILSVSQRNTQSGASKRSPPDGSFGGKSRCQPRYQIDSAMRIWVWDVNWTCVRIDTNAFRTGLLARKIWSSNATIFIVIIPHQFPSTIVPNNWHAFKIIEQLACTSVTVVTPAVIQWPLMDIANRRTTFISNNLYYNS